jgi:hypothetical protein
MKKKWALLMVMVFAAWTTFSARAAAQDKEARRPFYVGLGLENSMNSLRYYALSESAAFFYDFHEDMAVGMKMAVSENFSDTIVYEPEIFFRVYLLKFKWGRIFAQWVLGESLIVDDEEFYPMLLAGFVAGVHIPIIGFLYAEPYIRFGYPYAWGVGAMGGIRL